MPETKKDPTKTIAGWNARIEYEHEESTIEKLINTENK